MSCTINNSFSITYISSTFFDRQNERKVLPTLKTHVSRPRHDPRSADLLYTGRVMPSNREVEIKFRIGDIQALTASLQSAGFRLITPRTHEMNILYDKPGAKLRRRGALLRLREYGPRWTLTYKDKAGPQSSRHKSRELETQIANGEAMAQVLEA